VKAARWAHNPEDTVRFGGTATKNAGQRTSRTFMWINYIDQKQAGRPADAPGLISQGKASFDSKALQPT